MREYDTYLSAQYGPDLDGEDERLYYCDDPWCDGHAVPTEVCGE